MGEVITKSEVDLEFVKEEPRQPNERIQALSARLEGLPDSEREWFLSTIESLLQKASPLTRKGADIGRLNKESSEPLCASSS